MNKFDYSLPLQFFVETVPAELQDEQIALWQKNHIKVCKCGEKLAGTQEKDEYFEELYAEFMRDEMEYEMENYLWTVIAFTAKQKLPHLPPMMVSTTIHYVQSVDKRGPAPAIGRVVKTA